MGLIGGPWHFLRYWLVDPQNELLLAKLAKLCILELVNFNSSPVCDWSSGRALWLAEAVEGRCPELRCVLSVPRQRRPCIPGMIQFVGGDCGIADCDWLHEKKAGQCIVYFQSKAEGPKNFLAAHADVPACSHAFLPLRQAWRPAWLWNFLDPAVWEPRNRGYGKEPRSEF